MNSNNNSPSKSRVHVSVHHQSMIQRKNTEMLVESSGILGGKSYLHKHGTQIPTAQASREDSHEDVDDAIHVEVRQKLTDLNIHVVTDDYLSIYKNEFPERDQNETTMSKDTYKIDGPPLKNQQFVKSHLRWNEAMNTRYDDNQDNNIKIVDDTAVPAPYTSVTKLREGNVEVKVFKNEDFGLNIKGFKQRGPAHERAASIDALMNVNDSNNTTYQSGFKDSKFQKYSNIYGLPEISDHKNKSFVRTNYNHMRADSQQLYQNSYDNHKA